MDILVIGGTRFFGIPMVKKLIESGHKVTIATRGITPDNFGDSVERLKVDITDYKKVKDVFRGKCYDIVIDKMGYCSNEIRAILNSLECGRFIHMSTAGVYNLDHYNIMEDEFDAGKGNLIWCDRRELSYDDVKRNAERALVQVYGGIDNVSVRVPYVLGKNDYTNRLFFYVEHIIKQIPIYLDNPDSQICFVHRDDVSDLLIYLCENRCNGAINGCSSGTISIREIADYIETKTNRKMLFSDVGEVAPYNGTLSNSLNTEKAQKIGFVFSELKSWIYDLIDYYIFTVQEG